MSRRPILRLIAVVLAAAFVLYSCSDDTETVDTTEATDAESTTTMAPTTSSGDSVTTEPGSGETSLTVALPAEPSSMDAQIVDDGNMDHVALNVFEGLTTRAGDMSIEPQLAVSWEQTDATRWEFELRQDVMFHNGDPMTAEDVAFSINRIVNPDNESAIVSYMSTVAGAEVVDEDTVAITTNGPEPNLPAVLAFGLIAPQAVVEADAEGFARSPIGTGPYTFASWAPGEMISLSAFDDHWSDETPQVTEVEFVWREEPAVRFAALEAGEVDIAVSLSPEQAQQAPKVSTAPALEVTELAFDTEKGPLTDVRLRQAINMSIDRQGIIEGILLGYANPANGQLTVPSTVGYDPSMTDYQYDPDQARALVEEAGAVGTPVQFVAQRGRWVKDGEITEAVVEMIRETGLDVELEFLEWSQWLERIFDPESTVDITYFAGSNDTFDSSRILNTLVLCDATLSRVCQDDIDAMAAEAVQAETLEEKESIYHDLWQEVYDRYLLAPLANIELIYGMQSNVDFTARSDGRMKVAEIGVS